jgi:hypothetical protein
MSGQMRWSRSSVEMEHPDDSILLAYTREQALDEGWSSIRQHIDTCKECYQRSMEYAQISTELSETLEHFQRNQDYPPLVESVFELMHNPAAVRLARRQREEERRVRYPAQGAKWVFFRPVLAPTAALLLLLLFAVTVLAYRGDLSYLGHYILPQGQNSTVLPSIATVSSHTSTERPSGTVSATGTATKTPTIRLCTTNADKAQSRMRFCGASFTPGDKVLIVVHLASGGARTRHQVLVDAQGHFQDSWVVANCKDLPMTIDVQDETNSTEVSFELRGSHQLGHCSVPNSMSRVWDLNTH